MPTATIYSSESITERDPYTGVVVRQVTAQPSIHHPPFYYVPAHDDAMRWLVFVSHRTGTPQIFVEEQATRQLIQLTDRDDLNEWSIHPSHDGRYVYFTAGAAAWRVDIETFTEECLANFGDVPMHEQGMIGAAMGTTTLSHDDRYWAIPVKVGKVSRFHILDTETGHDEVILERDTIAHPEFHPNDSNLLRYAGPYQDRMWVIARDGSGNRLAYERDVAKKEWIVHEVWRPGTRELVTVNWPHGLIGVDTETGKVRQVARFNAWHAAINRTGTQMVADTTYPDRGLQLFASCNGHSQPRTICYPGSSNGGTHWNTDHCPYDDGPVNVNAPQHTHPHPCFSPDGKRVVFTSDRTGHAQVYEATLPEDWLE